MSKASLKVFKYVKKEILRNTFLVLMKATLKFLDQRSYEKYIDQQMNDPGSSV